MPAPYGPSLVATYSTINTGLWSILPSIRFGAIQTGRRHLISIPIVIIVLAGLNCQHIISFVQACSRWSAYAPFVRSSWMPQCNFPVITAFMQLGADHAESDISSSSIRSGGMGRGGRSLLGFLRPSQPFSASQVFCLGHNWNCRGRRTLGIDLRSWQNCIKKDTQIRLTCSIGLGIVTRLAQ